MNRGARDPRTGQLAFGFRGDTRPKQCNQCWKVKPLDDFINPRTARITQDCNECRHKRRAPVENHREGLRKRGEHRVTFTLKSGNRKTGQIPVSITSSETCPPSCSFYNAGCFGESALLRHHWRNAAKFGLSWDEFCTKVAALPEGTFWRHNEVGDLPGVGLTLDHVKTSMLAIANTGRRGFTYTHKLNKRKDIDLLLWVNSAGFTVNASADNLEQADFYASTGLPTTVVLPTHAKNERKLRTPEGRHIVVCPASTRDITCAQCQLCQKATRKSIVGFPAHGIRQRMVSRIVVLRRKD